MNLVSRLLRKNTSGARVAGFVVSNFIGLAIVMTGLCFYFDARTIWESDDSFVKNDYLVINKKVTSANTFGDASTSFTRSEIDSLSAQPWARRVGEFTSSDYRVSASVTSEGRGMSTSMFFESIPDSFVDVATAEWHYREGSREVPIIISKDYLTLYNFGFAGSAGLPQMSEGVMGSIPLQLTLRSDDGSRTGEYTGRVVGYSNRLNTILVPQKFMEQSNLEYGSGEVHSPSRVILDVSSPGDIAIDRYLKSHGLEVAGDKSSSRASFLLKVVTGIVLAIGIIITLLSLFILLLSVSLIMEKNREKLHGLLMLGIERKVVGRPYIMLITLSSITAFVMSYVAVLLIRGYYLAPLEGLGARPSSGWVAPVAGVLLTLLVMTFNMVSVRRKVTSSWRIKR